MSILGLSAYYHDAAAALVGADGTILFAASEERFTRKKHDSAFPANAIARCREASYAAKDPIERVVFYEDPLKKFDRIIKSAVTLGNEGEVEFVDAMAQWMGERLYQITDIEAGLAAAEVDIDRAHLFAIEHHLSHAASAFYPSALDRAAILTIDGVGEHATTAMWLGETNTIRPIKEVHYPNSLGLLYSAFTHFTGFKINSGEYKMMGLAPYGEPRYAQLILDNVVHYDADGLFHINQKWFDYFGKHEIYNSGFAELFGFPARAPADPLTTRYADVAASIQSVVEEIVIALAKSAMMAVGTRDLCMAGGVALNSVANGRIRREAGVDRIWIQPAAGDAGGALGAALFGHYGFKGRPRPPRTNDDMQGALLGTSYNSQEIRAELDQLGANYVDLPPEDRTTTVAKLLADGMVVGWFQGRMEFGPRALGARSILADARVPRMHETLNLKIKKREGFRPFAPAVLEEHAADWFDMANQSPFMLEVHPVTTSKRMATAPEVANKDGVLRVGATGSTVIPAVTHVDSSARVQTVSAKDNPAFHALLERFFAVTGCPLLVNTSFNVRGEPIVESPEQAFRCLVNTEMDYLAIGDCLVSRAAQDPMVVMRLYQEFDDD